MSVTILELRTWGRKALAERGIESPQLDADILLAACLRCTREMLLARAELVVPHVADETYRNLIRRRGEREPVAYLIGRKEFYGADFFVTPAVLIPRPETEILIEEALKELKLVDPQEELLLLDIGTGSGAIMLTLLREIRARFEFSKLRAVAVDLDEGALEVARINAENFELKDMLKLECSDLLRDLPAETFESGGFALIAANLPYIAASEELPVDVAKYEPEHALRGGEKGTELIVELIEQILTARPCGRGCAFFEIGYDQKEFLEECLAGKKSIEHGFIADLQGHPRVLRVRYSS